MEIENIFSKNVWSVIVKYLQDWYRNSITGTPIESIATFYLLKLLTCHICYILLWHVVDVFLVDISFLVLIMDWSDNIHAYPLLISSLILLLHVAHHNFCTFQKSIEVDWSPLRLIWIIVCWSLLQCLLWQDEWVSLFPNQILLSKAENCSEHHIQYHLTLYEPGDIQMFHSSLFGLFPQLFLSLVSPRASPIDHAKISILALFDQFDWPQFLFVRLHRL